MTRPTQAEIILPALRRNLALFQARRVNNHAPAPRVMAVVKADAYGHGAVPVAKGLVEWGVEILAVACLEEALELRQAGIFARVIILGPLRREEISEAWENGFTLLVSSEDDLPLIQEVRQSISSCVFSEKKLNVIIKIDTGMGRIGVLPEQVIPFLYRLRGLDCIDVVGIFSHLSCSESSDPEDVAYTRRQIEDFKLLADGLSRSQPSLEIISLANSSGIFNFTDSLMNTIRPGLMLYGVRPDDTVAPGFNITPVMRITTEICQIRSLPAGASISYGRKTVLTRPSRIAVLPIGYADGIQRRLPPGFEFMVRARPAPITGVITMDLSMIDVTDIPDAAVGDRVLVMGRDRQGRAEVEVRVEDHARAAGTIPYEVLTSIGKRVRRVWLGEELEISATAK